MLFRACKVSLLNPKGQMSMRLWGYDLEMDTTAAAFIEKNCMGKSFTIEQVAINFPTAKAFSMKTEKSPSGSEYSNQSKWHLDRSTQSEHLANCLKPSHSDGSNSVQLV